nr:unnamed protein product [Digitaria exilis]
MRRFSLLFLLCLVVLLLPLAANCDLQDVVCLGHGYRTAIDSNYETNIHHLTAILPSKISSSLGFSTGHEVGEFPEAHFGSTGLTNLGSETPERDFRGRWIPLSRCRNGTDSSSCRACITMALKEGRIACPDHREFVFSNGNCTLQLYGFQFDDLNTMESGIVSMAPENKRSSF